MDFEKKYPITQQPGEFITVQWTRGFKEVELYFNKHLLGTIQGGSKLKKGVVLWGTVLGDIQLKLSEKPITLDVIVNGFHSPVNVSHPVKELKKSSSFFWIISAMSFIAGAIEIGMVSQLGFLLGIVLIINTVIFITYILAAVFVSKGKPWAFFLGTAVFGLFTLLNLWFILGGFVQGFLTYTFEVFRLAVFGILLYNLKTAISVRKHNAYLKSWNSDLLDS